MSRQLNIEDFFAVEPGLQMSILDPNSYGAPFVVFNRARDWIGQRCCRLWRILIIAAPAAAIPATLASLSCLSTRA